MEERNGVNTDTSKTSLQCPVCQKQLRRPHVMPCLHVFCLHCLQDECQRDSPHQYVCPVCAAALPVCAQSSCARPWHAFERFEDIDNQSMIEQHHGERENMGVAEVTSLQLYQKNNEIAQHIEDDDSSNESISRKNSAVEQTPLRLFPCQLHSDKKADTFCFRCNQLACNKCISSFHRRCPDFRSLDAAVDGMRDTFDLVQGKMASNLVACEEVKDFHTDRIKQLDEMRTRVLIDIKTYRTELVNLILAKEKALVSQTNRAIEQMKAEAVSKRDFAARMSDSVQKQLDFLDLSFSINGEGELLPLLPGLSARVEMDAGVIEDQNCTDDIQEVAFVREGQCKETLTDSALGHVTVANFTEDVMTARISHNGVAREMAPRGDLNLTLMTSFHGGTRDDVTEPLLTDLILLANGDVILTDRDNRCVKKFNQSGQLLTRVVIEAAPSRIASVSHGRAVVSVMAKKALYFLSLLGTVRVLNTVPVKKIYSFLTSLGNGLLVAGTNQCDSIDLLSERGETLRKIFTQKHDRAVIARPLYLTPVTARPSQQNLTNSSTNHSQPNATVTDKHTHPHYHHSPTKSSTHHTPKEPKPNNRVKLPKASEKQRKFHDESNTSTKNSSSSSSSSNSNGNKININKSNNTTANNSSTTNTTVNNNSNTTNTTANNNSNTTTTFNNNNNINNNNDRTTSKEKVVVAAQHSSSYPHSQSKTSRRESFPSTVNKSSSSKPTSLTSPPFSSSSIPPALHSSSSLTSPTKKSAELPSLPKTSDSSSSPADLDLLVSDSGKRLLFRLRQDGQIAFTFKSGQEVTLECPLGVTVHECGLTLLADRDQDCVLLLDQEGNCFKKVLSDCDGLSKPCGLYAGSRGHVALTQVDGTVKIYRPS